jgi:hypothetical protein
LKTAAKVLLIVAAVFSAALATPADEEHIRWIKNGAPTETYVTGGPWTLEQSGAANGLYHTPKPKNGLGEYRTIGRVSLHSDREIVAIGQSAGDDAGDE